MDMPIVERDKSRDTADCKYWIQWSGEPEVMPAPPAIGTRVYCNINSLGNGTVEGYFVEHGYLGLIVRLDDAPAWHREQSSGGPFEGCALIFGLETAPARN